MVRGWDAAVREIEGPSGSRLDARDGPLSRWGRSRGSGGGGGGGREWRWMEKCQQHEFGTSSIESRDFPNFNYPSEYYGGRSPKITKIFT